MSIFGSKNTVHTWCVKLVFWAYLELWALQLAANFNVLSVIVVFSLLNLNIYTFFFSSHSALQSLSADYYHTGATGFHFQEMGQRKEIFVLNKSTNLNNEKHTWHESTSIFSTEWMNECWFWSTNKNNAFLHFN